MDHLKVYAFYKLVKEASHPLFSVNTKLLICLFPVKLLNFFKLYKPFLLRFSILIFFSGLLHPPI